MLSSMNLRLFSPSANERHVETLTMLSHFHRFESSLALGYIVNIGRALGSSAQVVTVS